MRGLADARVERVRAIVAWYARTVYGAWEGPGRLPWYCDPSRVGHFALAPDALARGDDDALFALFVAMSMFQVRRDVDVMAIQKRATARDARPLLSPRRLRVLVEGSRCEHVRYADAFDAHCSVARDVPRARGVCDHRPRTPCHVKEASQAMRRMGDMGKIPTSAFLHFYAVGGPGSISTLADQAAGAARSPQDAADRVVAALAAVHRVGRKLASMYVSALCVPALSPGLAPWYPRIDGAHLVVVDTNVSRAIDALRGRRTPGSYAARARWVQRVAARVDLAAIDPRLPAYAPRVVQQALFLYRSASNRRDRGDACADGTRPPCDPCVREVCPFA